MLYMCLCVYEHNEKIQKNKKLGQHNCQNFTTLKPTRYGTWA